MDKKFTKRRGRKTELEGEMTRKVTLTLDEKTLILLRALGDGNISRGVRESARVAFDRYQKT